MPNQLHALVDHLWQSTLFAVVAGLVTLAFRKNRAHVRYCLWLPASVKFLVPFSILVGVGSYFGRHSMNPATPAGLPVVVDYFSQSFSVPPSIVAAATPPASTASVNVVFATFALVWAIGFLALIISWLRRWQRVRAFLRTASPIDLPVHLKVMSSAAFIEPGVFGIVNPVLLVPAGIPERLTPSQLQAILAHELCHVRRRDNLATSIHMVVESVFWFHPLVWFLGARLMQEREHACDEEVLRLGSDPQVHVEGILRICGSYLRSPLPCVAGVSGSNLKKRIEVIMA